MDTFPDAEPTGLPLEDLLNRHPLPWRHGHKLRRNLYDALDEGVVMMPNDMAAELVVLAVNKLLDKPAEPEPEPETVVQYGPGDFVRLRENPKGSHMLGQISYMLGLQGYMRVEDGEYYPYLSQSVVRIGFNSKKFEKLEACFLAEDNDSKDYPRLGPECFTNRDRTVIGYQGANYYLACDAWVQDLPEGGRAHCVKRIGHVGRIHEAFDGTIREERDTI